MYVCICWQNKMMMLMYMYNIKSLVAKFRKYKNGNIPVHKSRQTNRQTDRDTDDAARGVFPVCDQKVLIFSSAQTARMILLLSFSLWQLTSLSISAAAAAAAAAAVATPTAKYYCWYCYFPVLLNQQIFWSYFRFGWTFGSSWKRIFTGWIVVLVTQPTS